MTILIAYDGSESADAAIAKAATFLGHDHADVVVLTVWEPLTVEALRANRFGGWPAIPPDTTEADDHASQEARQLAEHGVRLASEAGFEARAVSIPDDRRIADTIVETADEIDADLLVMGARGLAGIAAILGSVSNHVVQHTHRPVLVVPTQRARNEGRPIHQPSERSSEVDRDSAEEEYLSHEEHEREVGPSGTTRVKTDNI